MKTVAIIQARMGSTRLPGKVAMDVGGKTMLARVVERVRETPGVNEVVVAIPDTAADDPIVEICRALDVQSQRGSEHDVLDRYLSAARDSGADAVVRVTSDCPLLDPQVSGSVVRRFQTARPDYASNTLVRTFPRGLDTEILPMEILELAAREAVDDPDREHVTLFVWRQPARFRLLSVEVEGDHSHHRWTVDSPEDLELIRRIYGKLGDAGFGYQEVLDVLTAHPEWAEINAHVEQKKP
jgi:spore coat polysaccharide biosynthesis protein SpsF